MEAVRELTADRDLDPQDVDAGRDEVADLVERTLEIGLGQGHADPWPRRIAEQPEDLAAGGPIRIDPLDGGLGEALGLDLRDVPPIGLLEEFGLQGEVHGARCDVQRQLRRVEVVFEQRHRERQRDAGSEAARDRSASSGRRSRPRAAGRHGPGR